MAETATARRSGKGDSPVIVLFNKPFAVLCQFSGGEGRATLKDFLPQRDVYPAGRLDADSEGLVVLTGDGDLQARIADPRHKLPKIYWAQVEGAPGDHAIAMLRAGVDLGEFVTRPAQVRTIAEPAGLWPRNPPIRFRRAIPTAWLEIVIREGRNRQVRRMTAAAGLPTLRLVRVAVGPWSLDGLAPGAWREVPAGECVLSSNTAPRTPVAGPRQSLRRPPRPRKIPR